jgi:heme-degrading monooxygenase HmoA
MFARSVTIHLTPNSVAEFTRTLDQEIIPLLRKQKGFQDEISLVIPNGTEAVAISFWDKKENAEAYSRTTYPEVQKALAKVLDGTPEVQTYDVGNSTLHQIAARVGNSLRERFTNPESALNA